jgi:hypothetical protein
MEAAALPLHRPQVRTHGDRLIVDALVVEDTVAVRLAREREQAGDDPARLVRDAIEIGSRVLDREQAGAQADFVKAEFERAALQLETQFTERARAVSEHFGTKVDEVFSPDSGHLAKALERHFSDGSSASVQHRVKALVDEVMRKSREDLLRQFSAADGSNPLADFKQAAVLSLKEARDVQERNLRAMYAQLESVKLELQGMRDEKQKQLEVGEEREKGTAKGRSYEEAVFEAIDAIAIAQGDDADAVGDRTGGAGKVGDVVVDIDGGRGPARGRIVFEAKDRRLSRPEALRQLDAARTERSADYAVLVVPTEEELPSKTHALREVQGDKMFVVFDPEDGSRIALEGAYSLARARIVMARGEADGVDTCAVGEAVERALASLREVQAIKQKLSGAKSGIDAAREGLDSMADRVRGQLEEIDRLLVGTRPKLF